MIERYGELCVLDYTGTAPTGEQIVGLPAARAVISRLDDTKMIVGSITGELRLQGSIGGY
jgi:hypothetical protein